MSEKVSKTSSQYSELTERFFTKPFTWIQSLIKDAIRSSNFKSKLIEEYYMEISIPYTNGVLKTSLVILIIYVYMKIYYMSVYSPNKIYAMFFQSITLIILLVCLGSTLFLKSYRSHMRVALLAALTVIIQNMLSQYDIRSKMEITYSPIIQIVILSFSIMPISFTSAVSISMLTTCFLLIGTTLRMNLLSKLNIRQLFLNDTMLNILSDNIALVNNFNTASFIIGQLLLWTCAFINGCYMFSCNRIWRRSAFLTLKENLEVKKQSKNATVGQLRWIEAIMPRVVKDEYLLHNLDNKGRKWVYIKAFDSVSILFADIVGFTNMSSNKTASKVVTMLNDLFNRFDELCEVTNCEKLGTLGDCYYCVSGCPTPRPDHAISCVEMGLGMCRVIKQFNTDHGENVNMRVGIHTGRVNAAIIGSQRFRFDVYSNDVIIANAMESSGEAGRVHISKNVLDLIRHAYIVEEGSDLEIKREEDHGIAGMLLKSTFLKTYFVDPKSSHLQKKEEKFRKRDDFQVLDIKLQSSESSNSMDFGNENDDTFEVSKSKYRSRGKSYSAQINREIAFIETIKFDPDQQIKCFHDPPINMLTLKFSDPEIEWHYQAHTYDHIQNLSLYSAKFSPFVECVVHLTCTMIMSVACLIFFYNDQDKIKYGFLTFAIFGLTLNLIIIEFWKASTYYCLLSGDRERFFYRCLSHQIYKSFICIYMMSLPNLICFLLAYNCEHYTNDYFFQARYFSLSLFSMSIGTLFVSTLLWVKVLALILNFAQCIFLGCILTCEKSYKFVPLEPTFTCAGSGKLNEWLFINRVLKNYLFQYVFNFIVILALIRERERNLRIWFYVSREAEIGREEALRAMISSQELLYNIIPRYVFTNLRARGDNLDGKNFSYALKISKAAVVFACISNFFSKYYREDYKGGENALKILHQIITKFDDILSCKEYKDVEKIKTINDCYMLASGLNTLSTETNDIKEEHLVALMRYAFEMKRVLAHFNECYIFGTEKFEIKIGYNIGPITAGIIGSTKPMYDIWGDTVNVASRMYSTGKPGEIQVPHNVSDELATYFNFKYRGIIFVKGKGNMKTFLCLEEKKS